MGRGKKKPPAKDLVRLTPMQFSIAASVVVFIATLTFLFGYKLGLDASTATREPAADREAAKPARPTDETSPGTRVTFYEALTENRDGDSDRKAVRVLRPPEPAMQEKDTVELPEPPERAGEVNGDTRRPEEVFMVQAASFTQRNQAGDLLRSLSVEGFSGTVMSADLGERGTWYRVRIGPLYGQAEAEKVLAALREKRGLKGYIVR